MGLAVHRQMDNPAALLSEMSEKSHWLRMMLGGEVATEVVSHIGQGVQHALIIIATQHEVIRTHGSSRQAQMARDALVALMSMSKTDHRDVGSHRFRPTTPLLQPVPRREHHPMGRCQRGNWRADREPSGEGVRRGTSKHSSEP